MALEYKDDKASLSFSGNTKYITCTTFTSYLLFDVMVYGLNE